MRKDDDKKQPRQNALLGARLTAGVGGMGVLGNLMAAGTMDQPGEGDVEKILERMGASKVAPEDGHAWKAKDGRIIRPSVGSYELKTNDGKVLGVSLGAPVGAQFNAASGINDPKRRGDIHLDTRRGADTFFHELGHATGAGAKKGVILGRHGMNVGTSIGQLPSNVLGLGAATYAGMAKNKEEADHANSLANASLLAAGLREAPTLIEEARASLRARGLAKKFGKGLTSNTHLPAAYATYLTSAAVGSSPAIAAKILAKRRQRQFENTKGEASSEKRKKITSTLGAGVRGATGMTLGGGLGGAYGFSRVKSLANKSQINQALGTAGLGAVAGLGAGVLYDRYKRRKDAKRSK
jgi:hypothetical protein